MVYNTIINVAHGEIYIVWGNTVKSLAYALYVQKGGIILKYAERIVESKTFGF